MSGPFFFAWSGGAIEPQTVVVTNGNTYGARPVIATLVADIVGQQLQNIASTSGLEQGTMYEITGPGIASGTYAIYDNNSSLTGLPNVLNLSNPPSGNAIGVELVASMSNPVGTALGALTQGASTVTLSGITVPAGTYGVYGSGIGETDVPLGTTTGTTYTTGGGIVTIGSCILSVDSAGGGTLSILAATPHTHLGLDAFGQQTSITTYTVAAQPVRATTSGTFPLVLTGFPTGDYLTVDNIPAGVLDGLMPGLTYNISGNSIPVGTTFVAPIGGTAIILDQYTTDSIINCILTITGPRTPNAPWDASIHKVFDEDVLSVEISQDEGGLPTLAISLKNPAVGLLAVGRNLWCWLAWDAGWPDGPEDLRLLFNGRLVGVPQLQAGEVVTLQFLARPDDFTAQKLTLANSLAELPYYDPIWFDRPVNPDTVLETYSSLYHVDRTSLAVTVSDVLKGEDGTIAIGEDVAIYDKFSLSYGQPPLVATTVTATVSWQQQAEGTLDVTQNVITAFHNAGSAYSRGFGYTGPYAAIGGRGPLTSAVASGGGGLIQVLCGDGIKSDWPKPGATVGGGWTLSSRNDPSGVPLNYCLDAQVSNNGGWIQGLTFNVSYAGQAAPTSQAGKTTDQSNVNVFLHPFGQMSVAFPLNVYKVRMNLDYRADRRRTETVTAVLTAGVQMELSDSAENDRETISLTSEYVGKAVDADGAIPIGNVAYRSYFQTTRGALSFEYAMLAARAKMRARARSVDISFATDWRTALGITLRHNVALTDRRLPGGSAVGKVKSLRLTAGTAGMIGEFTMGCCIGTGVASTAQAGAPVWADPGYANTGYQVMAGGQVAPSGTTDFYYETLDNFAILDDGLDLTRMTAAAAVNECRVINGLSTQIPLLAAFHGAVAPMSSTPTGTMRTMSTRATLDMKPVQGAEYHTGFFPAVSQLALPKTIDLGAPHA